jgi:hypothetical protein
MPLSLQRLVVIARDASSRFQSVVLDGFDPRQELVDHVSGNPPKLAA